MENNFLHFTNSLDRIYCTLRYHAADKLLFVSWKGTAPEASIKKVKAGIQEMLKSKQARYIVNDVQEFFRAPTKVLAALTESDWDKEVSKLGVGYIAHVLKPGTRSLKSMESYENGLLIKFFFDKLEAVEWVAQLGAKATQEED